MPFDGFCVLTMDPATHVPTGEIVENGLPAAAMSRLTEIELSGADVNTFAALARADRHAAGLSAATDGDLDRSRRHRELRRPHGLGDELRAALVVDGTTWGAYPPARRHPARLPAADTALVAAVADALADGLRRATLAEACTGARAERGIGVLALAGDGTVLAVDPAAERWLAQLRDEPRRLLISTAPPSRPTAACLPRPCTAATTAPRRGHRRRLPGPRIAAGQAAEDGRPRPGPHRPRAAGWCCTPAPPRGRTRPRPSSSGPPRWRRSRPSSRAPTASARRERAVTGLVARGLATTAIGAELHLSPWTVQDHLKAIFGKVGVRSRGELVARLYFPADAADLTG